jgi:3-hydroxybutyryl-CoA dehydrogenase
MKKIEHVAIMGAGSMGLGIAMVFLEHPEYQVTLYNRTLANLEAAPDKIRAIAQTVNSTRCDLSRLKLANTIKDAVSDADFILESISEKLELKQAMFAECEKYAPATCIFSSNTSVKPITSIAENLADKTRMIGAHWWNPPYLIPLVEVTQTADTSADVIKATMDLMTAIGKVPVHVKKDRPGFVANRLQHALWREAMYIVEAGIADAETVDLSIKNSFGLRLSVLAPCENADMIGLEMTQDIHNVVLADLCDSHEPSPVLQQRMDEGRMGWSTGKGLYEKWTEEDKAAVKKRLISHLMKTVTR